MATAQGTSAIGRQVLIQVPNPTSVLTIRTRSGSLGQTGRLGWIALEQNVAGSAIVQMSGQPWWRDGVRWSFSVTIASVQAVVYWKKAGILWEIVTA